MNKMALSKEDLEGHWHLDKKVPLALLFAIIGQTACAAVWVGMTSERLTHLEHTVLAAAAQGDRLTRVEVKVDTIVDAVADIKLNMRATKN